MADIRRFTKTDWYAWAGAEKFKNDTDPFIYEKKLNNGDVDLVAIADRQGMSITLIAQDDEMLTWCCSKELTPILAEGYLRALVKRLEKVNSAPDLAYELEYPACKEFDGFERCI